MKEWKDYIKEKDAAGFVDEIRKAMNMSRAMGTEGFIFSFATKIFACYYMQVY